MTDMQKALVNINEASIEELTTISGIGLSLAKRIIDNRPYKELHDLVVVSGINEVKLASLLPYITLEDAAQPDRMPPKREKRDKEPMTKLGHTEGFVFLEDRNERQDALILIFIGFIIGLIILILRPSKD